MAINFGRVGYISFEEFLSTSHQIIWSRDFARSRKRFSFCITTTTKPMTTKPDKVVTYYKKIDLTKSQPFEHMVPWGHKIDQKHFICTTTIPMATKPGRVVTYNKEFSYIKSHVPFMTCSG